MTSFMVTRALSGLQGSYFQIAGQKLVTELFPPVSMPIDEDLRSHS
jgi:hypothetical protein